MLRNYLCQSRRSPAATRPQGIAVRPPPYSKGRSSPPASPSLVLGLLDRPGGSLRARHCLLLPLNSFFDARIASFVPLRSPWGSRRPPTRRYSSSWSHLESTWGSCYGALGPPSFPSSVDSGSLLELEPSIARLKRLPSRSRRIGEQRCIYLSVGRWLFVQ